MVSVELGSKPRSLQLQAPLLRPEKVNDLPQISELLRDQTESLKPEAPSTPLCVERHRKHTESMPLFLPPNSYPFSETGPAWGQLTTCAPRTDPLLPFLSSRGFAPTSSGVSCRRAKPFSTFCQQGELRQLRLSQH